MGAKCVFSTRTHAHTHISRVRAGLCASSEAWGVWRVFGGINGLQMSGTRWREGSNRSLSLIFSGAHSFPRSPSLPRPALSITRPAIDPSMLFSKFNTIFPGWPLINIPLVLKLPPPPRLHGVNLHLFITTITDQRRHVPAYVRLALLTSRWLHLSVSYSVSVPAVFPRLINEEQMRTINAHVLHTRPCQSLA